MCILFFYLTNRIFPIEVFFFFFLMLCVLLLHFQGFKYSLASPQDDLISSLGIFCVLLGTSIREIYSSKCILASSKANVT